MPYSALFGSLKKTVDNQPYKIAILFKEKGRYHALSYLDLYQKALKLGNLLAAKGIRDSDNVAILLGNQPEWPISFFAVQYNSAVAVPIDIKSTPEDIQKLVIHSKAKIVLCQERLCEPIREQLKEAGCPEVVIVDTANFFYSLPQPSSKEITQAVDDLGKPAAMFYTSGTTSFPKGVVLSQNNILSNLNSISKLDIARLEDTFISLLPLHHTYSFMTTCLLPLVTGCRISYPSGLSSEELIECINKTKVTVLVGVPQVFLLIHRAIQTKLEKVPTTARFLINIVKEFSWFIRKMTGINFSKHIFSKIHQSIGRSLRYIITGGARLEAGVISDFFKWGFIVLEGYGLTETSPVVSFNKAKNIKIGSIGQPIPGVEVRIVNPDKKGIGEIAVKGPNVMQGYYELPKETAKRIRDGWFFTGDLGFMDRQKHLFIRGRKDEMIVLSSGKNISPEEIENHYSLSPYIKEICVFPQKTKGYLQDSMQLMAVVVSDEAYFRKQGVVNVEEKIRWELENLSQKLTEYKRIKGFFVSKTGLPRTRLGKIMRHKINDNYLKELIAAKEIEEPLSEEDSILASTEFGKKALDYLSSKLKKKIKLTDHLELDLGLDSLARVELLLELQRLLKINIPKEQMSEVFYANAVKDLLLKLRPFINAADTGYQIDEFFWSKALLQKPAEDTLRMLRLKPNILDKMVTFIAVCIIKILFKGFFRLEVIGKNKLPKSGPCIFYPNHSSYLDGLIVFACLPMKITLSCYFLGFRQYFLNPIVKNVVKSARLIPIDITFDLIKAMQACAYVLNNSKFLCLFPEGQRSPAGEIIKFKKGIGILAKELDVPLIPVYIQGAFTAWPRYRKLPRPSKIRIIFGNITKSSQLAPKGKLEVLSYEEITELLRDELIKVKQ